MIGIAEFINVSAPGSPNTDFQLKGTSWHIVCENDILFYVYYYDELTGGVTYYEDDLSSLQSAMKHCVMHAMNQQKQIQQN